MTTKEQVIVWSEQADDYADKKLQCEGEYHPDWHEVRDAYFATLVRNAALEEAAQQCEYKGPQGNPLALINQAFTQEIRNLKDKS